MFTSPTAPRDVIYGIVSPRSRESSCRLVPGIIMASVAVNLAAFTARINVLFVLFLIITTPTYARKSGGGRYSHGSYGGSHSYPHSTGYSGTGTGGGHTYPGSTGLSGNNNHNHIPKQTATHQHNTNNYGHNSEVHHHYHYSPPQQVSYGSVTYPVYHAAPPVYVYQYRDSGSRFDNLLTGLALYNLGRMSANHHHYDSHREYVGTPGEVCKLGIRKSNGDYEETRIDCKLMSSMIWESEIQHSQPNTEKNTISSTVVNVTQVNMIGGLNTTVTVTNTTVVDALQSKGESIPVTPGMTCYMIRISRDTSALRREIQCGVLQAYAQNSWRTNSALRSLPVLILVFIVQMFLYHVS